MNFLSTVQNVSTDCNIDRFNFIFLKGKISSAISFLVFFTAYKTIKMKSNKKIIVEFGKQKQLDGKVIVTQKRMNNCLLLLIESAISLLLSCCLLLHSNDLPLGFSGFLFRMSFPMSFLNRQH